MPYLILARHGNTFEPGQKVVFVGGTDDPPLALKGLQQAELLGLALRRHHLDPGVIFSGPLRRTYQFAQIVGQLVKTRNIAIDNRLTEIDYGGWCGLSDTEVKDKYGAEALHAWNDKAIWPTKSGWGSDADEIATQNKEFVDDTKAYLNRGENVVAVTSNGRLKFFPKICAGEFERLSAKNNLKVATGRICILKYHLDDDNFQMISWNVEPGFEAFEKLRRT